ncbi:MAG: hypothetical protein CME65_08400 [Halobacteriovoraceae bacterium]|nr:hypothetical protein [Halobacteriovoraceae bacterium]|tara:strand:- start:8011 stop:8391 length:381 start_codon:yes stop_codon:yes gene_type:complete
MKNLSLALILLSLTLSQTVFSKENQLTEPRIYFVKKGDTLDQILYDHGYRGLYQNTITNKHLNPLFQTMWKNGLSHADLKRLYPGKVIYLPDASDSGRMIASEDNAVEDNISFQEIKQKVEELSSK